MTLSEKARQNRAKALDAVRARHKNIFAESFGAHRR